MLSNMSSRAYALFLMGLFTATFLLTCFMMAAGATASTTPGDTPRWAWSKNWDACVNDEQQPVRCVWHARTMGNGSGTSYIQTKRGHLIYITHRDAAALLRPTYAA